MAFLEQIVMIAVVAALLPVNTALHELGHAVVGHVVFGRRTVVYLGGKGFSQDELWSWTRQDLKIKLRSRYPWYGFVRVRQVEEMTLAQQFAIVAGGPLATLTVLWVAVGVLAQVGTNSFWAAVLPSGFAVVAVMSLIGSLVPRPVMGITGIPNHQNDGALLWAIGRQWWSQRPNQR